MIIVKELQTNKAIIPFRILNVESIARDAPIVPIEIADTKLKNVIW